MTKKQKKSLQQILIALALVILLKLLLRVLPALPTPVELLLYLIPYFVVGKDVLRKAIKGVKNRQPFDECFLMAVATVGAFALGDYVEGCAVILFYQIGELFQSVAVGKSRQSISSLMDIRPDYANVEDEDGKLEQVDPDDVEVGTVIVVQPGERVPIDGVIVEGTSALNTAALTGESLPRDVQTGDEVISGCVNMTGLLKVRTSKEFGESTVSKILDLVENSSMKKTRAENFITRFARVYTPAVCYGALALAFLPPIVLLLMGQPARFGDWIYRALTFLVISCPCALVISIPLSFFGGIGGASACGILVKGSTYLEELARTGIVVFDKTGTLTQGTFKVVGIHPENGVTGDALVEAAALAESWSKHPISLSIKNAYGKDIDPSRVTDVQELGGHGVTAKVDGKTVAAGNARLMAKLGLTVPGITEPGENLAMPRQDAVRRVECFDTVQAKLCMLFTLGVPMRPDQMAAVRLAMALYGGSVTSRLFLNVRERDHLCYYCSSSFQSFTGSMAVNSGVEHADAARAEKAILKELDDLRSGPITAEELEDCRRSLLSGMAGIEDTLGGIETWYYMEVLRGGPVQTPDDARAALQAVTEEDVRTVLRQLTLSVSYLLTREEESAHA